MTKVETERENCIDALLLAQKGADEGMVYAQMDKGLDSLISAVDADAFARGVAEGAEQERERIRHWIEYDAPINDDGVPYHDLLSYLTPKGAFHATQKEIDGEIESERKKYAALDASVLAPTKESEK